MADVDDGVTATARDDADGVTVVLVGEFDLRGVDTVSARVAEVLARRPAGLALDAGALTFVDSAGLHALMRAREAAGVAGVPFALVRTSEALDQLIEMAGLGEAFGAGEPA